MPKVFEAATRLLARREHSAFELTVKLAKKGYSHDGILEVLAECQRLGLQSEVRFAESLCRTRIAQGYGPIRIAQELQVKRINKKIIEQVLRFEQDNWILYATNVWRKKFNNQKEISQLELQKGWRFLLYRGFPGEVISQIMKY